MGSMRMGTGDERFSASMNASYSCTLPVSVSASSGRGFPSVWDTSNTETTLYMGIWMVFSSMIAFPSASSMGSLVSGSSFASSIFFLYGVGAMILMPFSPFMTFLPKLSRHLLKPATRVASGFCMWISITLLTLYLWNRLMVERYCLYLSDWNSSRMPVSMLSVISFSRALFCSA